MKLFYTKGACSLAVRIIINEIGIDCAYEAVDLKTKKTADSKDFLAINPKGAVPALELDSKQIITENLVIQQYLVDEFKATNLCPPLGNLKRYTVLSWSNYVSSEVHKSFANLFNPLITKEMDEQIFIPMILKKFKYLNTELGKHAYLVEDQFTMPDAYLFVMLLWAKNMNLDLGNLTHLKVYFAELVQRASIKKSLQEEGIEIK
ncbi:MAG: glutathione transferase GstA [Tatlockia sp.]|nr:glutathione transferase GstA [Tatlockia sp.]